MKIKIVSDGRDVRTVKVVNAETGEVLHGVQRVEWSADIHDSEYVPHAVIYLADIEVDLSAEASIVPRRE